MLEFQFQIRMWGTAMMNAEVKAALLALGLADSFDKLSRRVRRLSSTEANNILSDWKKNVLKPEFKAYAFAHHPDKGGSNSEMAEITRAYEILKGVRFASGMQWVAGDFRGYSRRVMNITIWSTYGARTYDVPSWWPSTEPASDADGKKK